MKRPGTIEYKRLLSWLIFAGVMGGILFTLNFDTPHFWDLNADVIGGGEGDLDTCPKTSAEAGTECCKVLESGELAPAVSAIYVRAECGCPPADTTYYGPAPLPAEYIAKNGAFVICDCNCPGS
ncbi:MAG: hypothetical protein ABH829_04925 [archaeon]